jgi:N-acetylneuraminic acid mutarotase
VLAVHTGVCGSLVTLACNDDFVGFSSTVTMNVRRNTTYYIEVADWQAGGNATKTLDFSIQIDPFTSLWQNINSTPLTLSTRQASVVVGSNLYLIGGRGDGGNLLNSFQKLDTQTGTWTQLPSIPANDQGSGLLNTTAVYLPAKNGLNPRIYVPGGSASANDSAYSRDHQYYEFTSNGLNTWHKAPELVGGTAVTETFAYAAAAPNNAQDGYFLTGGVVGQGYPIITTTNTLDQVLFYQPATDDWYPRASMTSPRYGHVAANVGGRLCVAGGLNVNNGSIALIPNGECASGTSPTSWTQTGNMQVPRFFAHSSVGPDGKWYVYGGITTDIDGFPVVVVPEVEVYDPATNAWSVLGLLYDLGGQDGKPLVWPAGGFVGNYLWTAGGSYDTTGNLLNPQVNKVQILGKNTYLPVIFGTEQVGNNHSFADAWSIPLNSTIDQNFSSTRTLVNVYSFTVSQLSLKQVALTGVASTANVNLYLFNDNKGLVESDESPFPGITKTLTLPLNPGRYYVVVRYTSSSNFPNDLSDYYQIRVNG